MASRILLLMPESLPMHSLLLRVAVHLAEASVAETVVAVTEVPAGMLSRSKDLR